MKRGGANTALLKEAREPLLLDHKRTAVPGAVAQNRPAQVSVLVNRADGAGPGGEVSVEMLMVSRNTAKRRGNAGAPDRVITEIGEADRPNAEEKRRGRAPPASADRDTDEYDIDDGDETYVAHEVQPHHTLQGIALQYRLTVEQLKRCNGLQTEQDLHTRLIVRIPATRHGALYNETESFAESGDVTTHTTRRVKTAAAATAATATGPPSAGGMDGGMIMGEDPAVLADQAVDRSAETFLERIDHEMRRLAVRAEPAALETSVGGRLDPMAVPIRTAVVTEHFFSLQALLPKDRRGLVLLAAGCVVAIVVVPVAIAIVRILHESIRAPPPPPGHDR